MCAVVSPQGAAPQQQQQSGAGIQILDNPTTTAAPGGVGKVQEIGPLHAQALQRKR